MAGMVIAPVEATLADAEPEMEPKKAEEITETFAAPARYRPATFVAKAMKASPPSPTPTTCAPHTSRRDKLTLVKGDATIP